jgi:TorA maturation chaperone TorD
MQYFDIYPQTPLFLRFYARCFIYPYEEMGYELQHLFREIERGEIDADEYPHLEQVLNVINHYQGEDLKDIRDNYVALFSEWEGGQSSCSLLASHFIKSLGINYDPETFIDLLIDSDIPIDPEDSMDSIVNYLEYFSILCDDQDESPEENSHTNFYSNHIMVWVPHFCDRLFRASNVSFYKEVAMGLNEFLLQTGE